jgi:hypothetical protein
MTTANRIRQINKQNKGIMRLIPIFVPRRFSAPGRRLRLHPDDYFALSSDPYFVYPLRLAAVSLRRARESLRGNGTG